MGIQVDNGVLDVDVEIFEVEEGFVAVDFGGVEVGDDELDVDGFFEMLGMEIVVMTGLKELLDELVVGNLEPLGVGVLDNIGLLDELTVEDFELVIDDFKLLDEVVMDVVFELDVANVLTTELNELVAEVNEDDVRERERGGVDVAILVVFEEYVIEEEKGSFESLEPSSSSSESGARVQAGPSLSEFPTVVFAVVVDACPTSPQPVYRTLRGVMHVDVDVVDVLTNVDETVDESDTDSAQ